VYVIKCWVWLRADFQAGRRRQCSIDIWKTSDFFKSWGGGHTSNGCVQTCTKTLQNSLCWLIPIRRGSALFISAAFCLVDLLSSLFAAQW